MRGTSGDSRSDAPAVRNCQSLRIPDGTCSQTHGRSLFNPHISRRTNHSQLASSTPTTQPERWTITTCTTIDNQTPSQPHTRSSHSHGHYCTEHIPKHGAARKGDPLNMAQRFSRHNHRVVGRARWRRRLVEVTQSLPHCSAKRKRRQQSSGHLKARVQVTLHRFCHFLQ